MTTAPYGSWPSPVTVDAVAENSGTVSWPAVAGDLTWWCAADPGTAAVRLRRRGPDGRTVDVLADSHSVRNRMLGYGGRPYAVDGARLVFTDHADGRVYRADARGENGLGVALTPPHPAGGRTWYADPQFPPGVDEVWLLREHTRDPAGPDDADPAARTTRDIVAVPLSGAAADDPAAVRVVARSTHFLTNLRPSPDGTRLAWIGWDHPAMPWEGTRLFVAELADGAARDVRVVLGGPDVSVPQAEWADGRSLYAMADPGGWWNLHRVTLSEDGPRAECVLPLEEDCAGAVWRAGATWFAVVGGEVVLPHGRGARRLSVWEPSSGRLRDLAPEWDEFGPDLTAGDRTVAAVAGSPSQPRAVVRVPLDGGPVVICTEPAGSGPATALSRPERRTAESADGQAVHYVFHPPLNPDVRGPAGGRPPLLVHVHGGPTSHTSATPDLESALFTSRGFAVASVDYGGSTGYGRAYRDRLRHAWGIVDVQDSVTVADALVRSGEVDPERVAIRGGSAGGWTTLAALTSTDRFCAGAVYYPISDAFHWSGEHTHDFESRYIEYLIGRLPDDRERFEKVSPLRHVDRITVPIVMLQGADDDICPPVHATTIIDAVRARGLWHRLEIFPGEGHGFRRSSSVAASLRAELELYTAAMHLDQGEG